VGYSGVGRLGEVVTFKKGNQRVEILSESVNGSGWFFTSGNHTLDVICDPNRDVWSPPLTITEKAIRFYALHPGKG
jgi:hypothetical protein